MEPRCIWDAKAELGEGVRYDAVRDAVWWVDILGQKIFRIDLATGEKRIWPTPEPVGCTFPARDGGVLALFRHSIVKLDESTGTFETLLSFPDEPASNRFNDGTVGPDGCIWAGSMDFDFQQPTGSLYLVRPDLTAGRMDTGYIVANGPVISPGGWRLYANETMKGEIFCFDRNPRTNQLSNKRLFAKIAEADGLPDGLCTDDDGGVWVALVTGGRVRRYGANGDIDLEIALPSPTVTSVTLGGKGGRTLFVTTGRILMDEPTLTAHPLSGGLFSVAVPRAAAKSFAFG